MVKISDDELYKLKESDRKLKERYKKQNEYLADKYDRLNITVPAGKKTDVEAAAKAAGVSINAFCRDAVLAKLSGNTIVDVPELSAYARSAGMTDAEYISSAVLEKMQRQDEAFKEEITRESITE